MDNNLLIAISNTFFSPTGLLTIFSGVFLGIVIGALPGFSVTMGIVILFPLSFAFEGLGGILLLLGMYVGAVYGGSISAVLLNTPGTPASAATSLDGYPMARRGEAGRALGISTISSFGGGIVSCILLILVAPLLAKVALKYSAPEYFALALFGLSIISSISGKSVIKGMIGGIIGLLISTIGIDNLTGYTRFTFNNSYLMGGVSFVPILIGLFAFSQVLLGIEEGDEAEEKEVTVFKAKRFLPTKDDIKRMKMTVLRSGLIGTLIGSIPGTGGDIAAFISYNEAKRFSKNPEEFGKGAVEGISAPEAGNNAVTGGTLVPLLTLGIPGDSVTAILLGAFMVQGLQPGPLLFKENADQVYTIFIGMIIANIFMVILGLLGIPLFTKVLKVPKHILTPIIVLLTVIGSFAINNTIVDVFIMILAGIIGYVLFKFDFSASPIVIGLILGPMAEGNLRRALIMSKGDYSIFFQKPISLLFIVLAIITLFLPIIRNAIDKRKESAAAC